MLKTHVKASRVTNLTDARYFAAWEVDWVGFTLDPASEYYVNPKDLMAIREWLTGPKIIGEFGMQDLATILETAAILNLDGIQLSGFDTIEHAKAIKDFPVFTEIVIDHQTSPEWVSDQCKALAPFCKSILLEFSKNNISWEALNNGNGFKARHLKTLCANYPVLLSMACPIADVENMLNEIKPIGLNLFGGEEEKIGVKSFDEIDEIFELLYVEEG